MTRIWKSHLMFPPIKSHSIDGKTKATILEMYLSFNRSSLRKRQDIRRFHGSPIVMKGAQ